MNREEEAFIISTCNQLLGALDALDAGMDPASLYNLSDMSYKQYKVAESLRELLEEFRINRGD